MAKSILNKLYLIVISLFGLVFCILSLLLVLFLFIKLYQRYNLKKDVLDREI